MEAEQIARRAVEAASDKQADDIVLLDMRGMCTFADYFVICSGETQRQIEAIAGAIDEALSKEKVEPFRHEGGVDSGWLLIDYGDVIIHIFNAVEREYYKLERLWSKATPLVRIQ